MRSVTSPTAQMLGAVGLRPFVDGRWAPALSSCTPALLEPDGPPVLGARPGGVHHDVGLEHSAEAACSPDRTRCRPSNLMGVATIRPICISVRHLDAAVPSGLVHGRAALLVEAAQARGRGRSTQVDMAAESVEDAGRTRRRYSRRRRSRCGLGNGSGKIGNASLEVMANSLPGNLRHGPGGRPSRSGSSPRVTVSSPT